MSGEARSSARGGRGARQHVDQQKELVRAVQVRVVHRGWVDRGWGVVSFLRISSPGHRPATLAERDPGHVAFRGDRLATKLPTP